MNNQNQYQLKIADYIIDVCSLDDSIKLIIPDYLADFITNTNEKANVNIQICNFIPEFFNNNNVVFDAAKEKNTNYSNFSLYNWCICETNARKFIKIYKHENYKSPEIIVEFDRKAKQWDMYYEKGNISISNNEVNPFIYPLGPLILYYINTFNDGIMIHSSGVLDNNKGYLFSGVSGIGKTTISKIWNNEEALIINDDRLVIRKKDNNYFMFNTPMNYKDIPKIAPLNYIFLLKQSPKNYSKKIKGTEAIARLMANCIQHNYNADLINSLISACSEICQSLPVYELGFIPDRNIVHFIRNNEFN